MLGGLRKSVGGCSCLLLYELIQYSRGPIQVMNQTFLVSIGIHFVTRLETVVPGIVGVEDQ